MAYRRTERVEAQQADRRRRILRAARLLIAEGGFHQAPVAAVAALAGLATGTVYRYFPSKSQLFAETIAETSQHELEVIAATARGEGSARKRLAAVVEVFSARALRAGRVAYALVAEPVDPEVDAIRKHYRLEMAALLENLVAEGIAAGEFPPQDARAAAICLVGACMESLAGPLRPESTADAEERAALVPHIVEFCQRAVAGPPDAIALQPREPRHVQSRRR